ncbi:MAG: alpha/beta hydrolase [Candidatus Eremiobacteraeota bacterium]|nr:alpha/beta hydrolase [Candidatus Eremiobacteraeota bacterium]
MIDEAYQRTRVRLETFLARDHAEIGEYGRSLVYDHGRPTSRVALLLHGLSASPPQFSAIAQSLYARGYNVFVPRLPRHGYSDRMSDALATLTADQLTQFARESLSIARGLGKHVTVVGFSLGGLLAAYLGQHENVDSVVAVAPFLGIFMLPNALRAPVSALALLLPNRFHWWDARLKEKQLPEHGYPRYATHAIAHALAIASDVLDAARTEPPKAQRIVVVTNARESAVNNRATGRLVRRWRERAPETVRTHVFADLPFLHDIIEPKRHVDISARVLRVLVELIDR